jgi:adenylate cyclase
MSTPDRPEKQLPPSLPVTLQLSPLLTRFLVMLLVTLLTLGILAQFKNSLGVFETRLSNVGWTLNSDYQPESRMTIIAIDEKSLNQIGPWPWPRETLAKLSKVLTDANVSLQLYDIVFPEAKPGDEILINALKNSASVIAQVPVMNSQQRLQTGLMGSSVLGMRCQQPLPTTYNYLANHSGFKGVTKGHITPIVASDGSINRLAPFICVEGQVYPMLALSGLFKAAGIEQPTIEIVAGKGILEPHWIAKTTQYPGLEIPLDDQGNMRVSYRKSPDSYRVISAADVLNEQLDLSLLENTWVQIGATAFGLGDVVPTPYSGQTPGIEIQARLLTSLLDNDFPYTPRYSGHLLTALAAIFAGIFWALSAARGKFAIWGLPLAGICLSLSAWLLHVQLLISYNIWLGWLGPALFSLFTGLLLSLLEHHRSRLEQIRIYDNLDSYLPPDIANKIAYNLPSNEIEVERKKLTLLSADLRNFSAFSEACSPETSVALLHQFFVLSCDIIEQKGGSVHELKGDAILAVWADENVVQALAAAEQLQEEVSALLVDTALAEAEFLALGIGIEQGTTLLGSIGPSHRRTHTMLGDTVTITLRIQEMTSDLAQPILIGPNAARQLPKSTLESQGEYLLAGLRKPHTLFAPFIGSLDDREKNIVTPFKLLRGGAK